MFSRNQRTAADKNEHLKGIVHKVSCRMCSFTYIEESKRRWKSWGAEHKRGCRLHGKTACPNHWPRRTPQLCQHFGNRRKNQGQKILYIHKESLHSFLDKDSVNEKAPFPRVSTWLVSSLRGNEHWHFCYMFAFRDLQNTRPQKAVENSVLTFFRSV